jgi:hypothetical protein
MQPCPVIRQILWLVVQNHLGTPVRMLPQQQACAHTSDVSCGMSAAPACSLSNTKAHLLPQQQGRTSNYSSSCDDPGTAKERNKTTRGFASAHGWCQPDCSPASEGPLCQKGTRSLRHTFAQINQSINVTPVAMRLKKHTPSPHTSSAYTITTHHFSGNSSSASVAENSAGGQHGDTPECM